MYFNEILLVYQDLKKNYPCLGFDISKYFSSQFNYSRMGINHF